MVLVVYAIAILLIVGLFYAAYLLYKKTKNAVKPKPT